VAGDEHSEPERIVILGAGFAGFQAALELDRTVAARMREDMMIDVLVIGAGPAGVVAAIRAAELGAHTRLVTSGELGGMAANDGPVPVRTLAYAARLLRDARQLTRYGIMTGNEPVLQFEQLLARIREVVLDVRGHSALRERIDALGVMVHDHCGPARFVGPNTIETERGLRLEAAKLIISTGGVSRRLDIPGIELTSTHSDVWRLTAVPSSMLVVGGGSTGVQIASMFHAFGAHVQLFQAGPRILPSEDEAVAAAVAGELRSMGVIVNERMGAITSFEKTARGVRMNVRDGNHDGSVEADLAVVAAGWVPDTAGLNLAEAGVAVDARGRIRVDDCLRTSAPHIFAAGDVTGRLMLVPGAVEDGFVAATNAVQGGTHRLAQRVSPSGSFTHPEYAQVGLTEAKARETHAVVTALVPYAAAVRAIIEGRTFGFCKLVADRSSGHILGCQVVGEHAVEIAQLAAIAIAAQMRLDELARVAVSFPTYAEVLIHAAVLAAAELALPLNLNLSRGGMRDLALAAPAAT
jgi:pyruvate/2-oxoglutarate dehydrogenase complex dihydrolipoamide dehydrogenase (E3) component